jgi:hypothetical protein
MNTAYNEYTSFANALCSYTPHKEYITYTTTTKNETIYAASPQKMPHFHTQQIITTAQKAISFLSSKIPTLTLKDGKKYCKLIEKLLQGFQKFESNYQKKLSQKRCFSFARLFCSRTRSRLAETEGKIRSINLSMHKVCDALEEERNETIKKISEHAFKELGATHQLAEIAQTVLDELEKQKTAFSKIKVLEDLENKYLETSKKTQELIRKFQTDENTKIAPQDKIDTLFSQIKKSSKDFEATYAQKRLEVTYVAEHAAIQATMGFMRATPSLQEVHRLYQETAPKARLLKEKATTDTAIANAPGLPLFLRCIKNCAAEFEDHYTNELLRKSYEIPLQNMRDLIPQMLQTHSLEELEQLYQTLAPKAQELKTAVLQDAVVAKISQEKALKLERDISEGVKNFTTAYSDIKLELLYRPEILKLQEAARFMEGAKTDKQLHQKYDACEPAAHGLIQRFNNDIIAQASPLKTSQISQDIVKVVQEFDEAFITGCKKTYKEQIRPGSEKKEHIRLREITLKFQKLFKQLEHDLKVLNTVPPEQQIAKHRDIQKIFTTRRDEFLELQRSLPARVATELQEERQELRQAIKNALRKIGRIIEQPLIKQEPYIKQEPKRQ